MTDYRRALSLSPGNEQALYWGSEAAAQEGSRNVPGIRSPAIDAMIAALTNAQSPEAFQTAARALDRALTTGRYVIPIWTYAVGRIAHDRRLHYPDRLPLMAMASNGSLASGGPKRNDRAPQPKPNPIL